MGISTQRATVNVHGSEKFMDAVVSRTGKKTDVSPYNPSVRSSLPFICMFAGRNACGSGSGVTILA
ncbi:hypothetical protein BD414DRAFT_499630 [Trametes punicea]|nr:hypothetical protein BD414DRAFT_499630 [Trametes punicea]